MYQIEAQDQIKVQALLKQSEINKGRAMTKSKLIKMPATLLGTVAI